MRIIVLLPLLGIAGVASAQAAPTPDATPTVLAAKGAKAKPKMKCETVDETGSRLGHRKVCYDPNDRQDVRNELDRIQRNIPGRPGG